MSMCAWGMHVKAACLFCLRYFLTILTALPALSQIKYFHLNPCFLICLCENSSERSYICCQLLLTSLLPLTSKFPWKSCQFPLQSNWAFIQPLHEDCSCTDHQWPARSEIQGQSLVIILLHPSTSPHPTPPPAEQHLTEMMTFLFKIFLHLASGSPHSFLIFFFSSTSSHWNTLGLNRSFYLHPFPQWPDLVAWFKCYLSLSPKLPHVHLQHRSLSRTPDTHTSLTFSLWISNGEHTYQYPNWNPDHESFFASNQFQNLQHVSQWQLYLPSCSGPKPWNLPWLLPLISDSTSKPSANTIRFTLKTYKTNWLILLIPILPSWSKPIITAQTNSNLTASALLFFPPQSLFSSLPERFI